MPYHCNSSVRYSIIMSIVALSIPDSCLLYGPCFLPSNVQLLPLAVDNTADTLSLAALIVEGGTHFEDHLG